MTVNRTWGPCWLHHRSVRISNAVRSTSIRPISRSHLARRHWKQHELGHAMSSKPDNAMVIERTRRVSVILVLVEYIIINYCHHSLQFNALSFYFLLPEKGDETRRDGGQTRCVHSSIRVFSDLSLLYSAAVNFINITVKQRELKAYRD